MSFAIACADPQALDSGTAPEAIDQLWWPAVSLQRARQVMRLNGTVTNDRLLEALQNAAYSVNDELQAWSEAQRQAHPDGLPKGRLTNLYLRAVHFYAKAELVERYRDFDATGAGDRRADDHEGIPDEARRNMRWAISDILGKPRATVEAL
ncbi:head completion/stabilization protein [Paracandidimonas soli]|uniref:Head completion protein GPL n=1 Tax=Paracandidimonas soli TaxID=1917182 RepID=A0A4R3VCW4_9BURK|nr:head completion/stabilization protein [Paracandidimonas soli]TCV00505.1 head completion protein GPL [Paracandidimonas soli]